MGPPLLRANVPWRTETGWQAMIVCLPSPELFKNGIPFKEQESHPKKTGIDGLWWALSTERGYIISASVL